MEGGGLVEEQAQLAIEDGERIMYVSGSDFKRLNQLQNFPIGKIAWRVNRPDFIDRLEKLP